MGAQELCESRGGRPGLLVRDSPYGLCGRKATLNLNIPVLFLLLCVVELVVVKIRIFLVI